MIALDREPMTSRCGCRKTACKSPLRQARAHHEALDRRASFAVEESAAAGAIELYLEEIGRVRALTPQAERLLAAKAQRGDKAAREELLKANLPLVVSLAQEFEGFGLSLFDLIAEGNLGLMKALGRFDPAKAEQLSSLASLSIRQAIKRALATHARSGRQA